VANEVELIIQLPRGSSIDVHLREEPPASITDGRVVVERLQPDENGLLQPPEAGEVILDVLAPEALRREPEEIRRVILAAASDGGPLIVLIEGAEYLRENELDAVLAAAAATDRVVILRILRGV
jgi:hypothetical protein